METLYVLFMSKRYFNVFSKLHFPEVAEVPVQVMLFGMKPVGCEETYGGPPHCYLLKC